MVGKAIFLGKLMFVDKSKFNKFSSCWRTTVRRKPTAQLSLKNLLQTAKHGSEGIMDWKSFTFSGIGNLIFNENNFD